MRWKNCDIPKWLDWALMVMLSPIIACVFAAMALMWLDNEITERKRRWIGPSPYWRRWWAWFPVTVDGQQVWLEWVWRQSRAAGHCVWYELDRREGAK